ncbi:MAG: RNA-binding S4 domain-containing protein [Sphingomonadaceae bacterium]|nr:RNA-binding S4 domain-containing protein [Sphingomonadaceae bacterium]
MRIDKLLWFLRLAGSRGFAQAWVLEGHIRLNGRRIEKPSAAVGCGDVLTLPMRGPIRGEVRIIEILALPTRRGPAGEAQSCYRVLDASAGNPIAAGKDNSP